MLHSVSHIIMRCVERCPTSYMEVVGRIPSRSDVLFQTRDLPPGLFISVYLSFRREAHVGIGDIRLIQGTSRRELLIHSPNRAVLCKRLKMTDI